MTLKKLLYIIAGGLGVLGSFLPWVAVTFFVSVRVNAFGSGDALMIILALLALVCGVALILLNVMKEKQIKNLIKFKKLDKLPLYIGVALAAIAVIAFVYIKANGSGVSNPSFGVWMIAIAGVGSIVLSCLKNVDALDKIVIGEKTSNTAKSDKSDKPEKAPAKKSEKSENSSK